MSTRCNIIVKDEHSELIFYRHCDGYPDGAWALPLLNKFVELVQKGHIRDDVGQSAGWLILLGAAEYNTIPSDWLEVENYSVKHCSFPKDWKVGSIEPTTQIHWDIEYLYVIDLTVPAVYIDGENDYKYEGIFSHETA